MTRRSGATPSTWWPVVVVAGLLSLLAGSAVLVSWTPPIPEARAIGTETRLEIATIGTADWADMTTAAWELVAARPGDRVQGAVALRLTEPAPPGTALVVTANSGGDAAVVSPHLLISSMSLDGVDLLATWSDCGATPLTLALLMTCLTPPLLPLPSTAGSEFAMELTLAPTFGNVGQGTQLDDLRVAFALHRPTAPGSPALPNRPNDGTPAAPPPAPVPPADAVPTVPPGAGTAADPEGPGALVPVPAVTGYGPGGALLGSPRGTWWGAATLLLTLPAAWLHRRWTHHRAGRRHPQ